MVVVLSLALAPPAWGGTSVSLPDGVDPTGWRELLAEADLELRPAPQAQVTVRAEGGQWRIDVPADPARRLDIPVPSTASDRVAVVWLLASLAEDVWYGRAPGAADVDAPPRPVPTPAAPALATRPVSALPASTSLPRPRSPAAAAAAPAGTPTTPPPPPASPLATSPSAPDGTVPVLSTPASPVMASEASVDVPPPALPEPVASAPPPAPLPDPPPAVSEPPAPPIDAVDATPHRTAPRPRPSLRVEVSAQLGAGFRTAQLPTARGTLGVGLVVADHALITLGGSLAGPEQPAGVATAQPTLAGEVFLRAGWAPSWTWAPRLEIEAAVGHHAWRSYGDPVGGGWVPSLGGRVGVLRALPRETSIGLVFGVHADQRRVVLLDERGAVIDVAPVSFDLGILTSWRGGSRRIRTSE
jgi:hypothetical protein